MDKLLFLIALTMFSVSAGYSDANAAGSCTICLNHVADSEIATHKAYTCSQGHCIDRECLAHQVASLENVQQLEFQGLPCCGKECQEKLTLTRVRELLDPEDRIALDARLAKTASKRMLEHQPLTALQRLSQGIEDAFNLCCPNGGCGQTLDEIEGCNAATCSNEKCKATFCYLCLKPQKNLETAHVHALKHSGDFWELRAGYKERYQWLLARRKFANLFGDKTNFGLRKKLTSLFSKKNKKIPDSLRRAALESRKTILEENKIWPMPAGLTSQQWIQEVRGAHLPFERTIELLQNEHIYRHQEGDLKNAALVEAELKRLGGVVLSTLDIEDAPVQRREINPVMADDPRVSPGFRDLGPENMYQVGNLIWSAMLRVQAGGPKVGVEEVEGGMNQRDAEQFCQSLGGGSRLPTRAEYQALVTAMIAMSGGRYDPRIIPDMSHNFFWSSTVSSSNPNNAYDFNGDMGEAGFAAKRDLKKAVRCVITVQ